MAKNTLASVNDTNYYNMLDPNQQKSLDQKYSVGNPQRLAIFKDTAARDMMASKLNDAYNKWVSMGSQGKYPYEQDIYKVSNNPYERRWLLEKATGKGMDQISNILSPSEQNVHNANIAQSTGTNTTGTASNTTGTPSQNSALTARQQSAIAGLEQQKQQYVQQIASQKGQSDVVAAQNANKLRELMANAGLTSSGQNVSATANLLSARQNALNSLDQQQNNYNAQINAQEQGVLNDLSGQDFAQRMAQQQFDWQKQQDMFNNSMNQAQMTGIYNNPQVQQLLQTIDNAKTAYSSAQSDSERNAAHQAADQARQQLSLMGYDSNIVGAGVTQQQARNNYSQYLQTLAVRQMAQQQQNWQDQFDWQKQQADAQQAWQKYQYNNMSAAQKAQFDQNAQQFGQNMAWNMWNAQYNGNLQQAMLNAQLASFNDTSGGGDYNNYKMMPQAQKSPNYRNFVQDLSSAMKKTGVPESWLTPLSELVGRESSWNSSAKNPSSTAHGYAQFLDSTVKNYAKYGNYNNPVDQLVMMMHYIKDRYGTPQNALKFWDANHYY